MEKSYVCCTCKSNVSSMQYSPILIQLLESLDPCQRDRIPKICNNCASQPMFQCDTCSATFQQSEVNKEIRRRKVNNPDYRVYCKNCRRKYNETKKQDEFCDVAQPPMMAFEPITIPNVQKYDFLAKDRFLSEAAPQSL